MVHALRLLESFRGRAEPEGRWTAPSPDPVPRSGAIARLVRHRGHAAADPKRYPPLKRVGPPSRKPVCVFTLRQPKIPPASGNFSASADLRRSLVWSRGTRCPRLNWVRDWGSCRPRSTRLLRRWRKHGWWLASGERTTRCGSRSRERLRVGWAG